MIDWRDALFARRAAGVKLDLSAVRAADAALGHPAAGARHVQVVGTNGKGSVAAMIAHGLVAGGRRVGLFTSPHLHRIGERIRIDGAAVPDERVQEAVSRVLEHERAAARGLTFFEVITLAAWCIFADARVDDVVLEAGLGGRLDSTSARTPALVAITTIAMDHQAFLGETLEAIAAEKAAVIRAGSTAVSAPQRPEARAVIEARASQVETRVEWCVPAERAPVGLPGAHQAMNAGVALAALRRLAPGRPHAVGELDDLRWPGRAEVLRQPDAGHLILDVAHNPDGARALAAWLRTRPSRPRIVVLGVRRDKDAEAMVAALGPVCSELWCAATFPDAAELLDAARRFSDFEELHIAITRARREAGEVVVTGSHQLVGPVRARTLGIDDAADRGLSDPLVRPERGRSRE